MESVILSAGACATTVIVGCYAALCLVALAMRSRYLVVIVTGTSMTPGYQDGDRVLVRRRSTPLENGAVAVLRPPETVLARSARDEPYSRARQGAAAQVAVPPESPAPASATALAGALTGRLTVAARSDLIIKRVAALAGDPVPATVLDAVHGAAVVPAGALVVLSDAPDGTDSRRWGFVQADAVIGTAVRKLPAATGEESATTGGDLWPLVIGGIRARQRPGRRD